MDGVSFSRKYQQLLRCRKLFEKRTVDICNNPKFRIQMLFFAFVEILLRFFAVLKIPASEITFNPKSLHFYFLLLKCLHYLGSKIALYKGDSRYFLQFFLDSAQSVRNCLLTDALCLCNINYFSALDINHLKQFALTVSQSGKSGI